MLLDILSTDQNYVYYQYEKELSQKPQHSFKLDQQITVDG